VEREAVGARPTELELAGRFAARREQAILEWPDRAVRDLSGSSGQRVAVCWGLSWRIGGGRPASWVHSRLSQRAPALRFWGW